ncbi:TetR/AcrR family transcriptional regulator [Candidatus Halocynthiibacter alkanivorans]|uniref:acrylate utilization transcriptional regulator AcuR n=1 Tax=Candidatus Halocynthiibacter alkanivorans TaxID=2267619 RepID=UPI000DF494B7|nr:TetR/AcrR family transcriptional regulator [Candidatus Halocynthiibacter alkanivorans]
MSNVTKISRPRGRPAKDKAEYAEIRDRLIREGVALLTEKGFASTNLDEIVKKAGVPKGSFYAYFENKEAFGLELIDDYARYFERKLDKCYGNIMRTPLERISDFMLEARENMARFDFRRGCLVGNLGQEMAVLPGSYRQRLVDVFRDWEVKTGACLRAAQDAGEIDIGIDCAKKAEAFWIGWEGAILRAKLGRSAGAIDRYSEDFLDGLGPKSTL